MHTSTRFAKCTHWETIATFNLQLLAGTFTKGPIRFSDDILGSLVTLLGCNPGKCHFRINFDIEPY